MSAKQIAIAGLIGVVLLTSGPSARAAEPLADKVRGSIDKGVNYLKKHQENRGGEWNWENTGITLVFKGGSTCLATLSLLNSGVSVNDPVIQRVLPYIRKLKADQTYVLALQAMVLAEVGEAKDLNIIQGNVDALLNNRIYNNGAMIGWSYGRGGKGISTQADNSNTQYALLGLLAGRQAGVKIDVKDWEEIQKFYVNTLVKVNDPPKSGGWTYNPAMKSEPTHTMTIAGLSGLFISGLELNMGKQKLDEKTGIAENCGKYDENEAVTRGMLWLAKKFKLDLSTGNEQHKATFYNIYGVERVGRLSGQRFIGEHDWYREGCEQLCGVRRPATGLAQGVDGSWQLGSGFDHDPVISTSFALLFLSKGRTPILLSKLAFDGKDDSKNDWNRKHHDARNLVDYASKALFKKQPLGWQIFDPRLADIEKPDTFNDELSNLLLSPILYMNGHAAPKLTEQQIDLLRRYVEEGGFIFAEACCGSPEFTAGFRDLMKKVFKEDILVTLRADHPVWSSHMPLDPKEFIAGRKPEELVQCIERGCKTVVIFTPQPLAGFWEEYRFMPQGNLPPANRAEMAYRFAGNVIAYATGLEMPKQKLSRVDLTDRTEAKNITRHALKLAQLRHDGDWKPAPQAMRVLAGYLVDHFKIQVTPMKNDEDVRPGKLDDLLQYKFMYMHGRREFTMDEGEISNLRQNLRTGGTLFADACCGAKEYDKAFRDLAKKLYPDKKLERIPLDDFLYSEKLNGRSITSVKCRREKADGAAALEYEDVAPELEGVKVGVRWVIIYSKYDIGCALEKSKSSACKGYDHESAKILAAAAVLYSLKR